MATTTSSLKGETMAKFTKSQNVYTIVEREVDGDKAWWVKGASLDEPIGPYKFKAEAIDAQRGQVKFDKEAEMPAKPSKPSRKAAKPKTSAAKPPKVKAAKKATSKTLKPKAANQSLTVVKGEVGDVSGWIVQGGAKPLGPFASKKAAQDVMRDAKPPKAKKAPKARKSTRPKVLDTYSVGPFCRWLGKACGFNVEQATELLESEKRMTLTESSLKWELKERRETHSPAPVTTAHGKELRSKYKKLFTAAKDN